MAIVLIEVLGFNAVERHALNSLLRISQHRSPSYDLWTDALSAAPTAVLIDAQMPDAAAHAELACLRQARILWFGLNPPECVWRVFSRPIPWVRVLQALDEAYALSQSEAPIDLGSDFGEEADSAQSDYADTAPPALVALSSAAPAPKRLLIVDDDVTARLYMRAKLASLAYTFADEAKNGEEALQLAAQHHYHGIFLDVDMPGSNGYEVCRALKRLPRSAQAHSVQMPAVKVIMVTGRSGMIDRMRGSMCGADAFISKPPLPASLSALILTL